MHVFCQVSVGAALLRFPRHLNDLGIRRRAMPRWVRPEPDEVSRALDKLSLWAALATP